MLQGKKIGFVLTINHLGNSIILQEIKKIMCAGAEVFIILLNPEERKEKLVERLQGIFVPVFKKSGEENIDHKTAFSSSPDSVPRLPRHSFPDLLVLIPDSEIMLNCLEQIAAANGPSLPLVMITAPGKMPALPLKRISSLMKKKGVFFVPFGPIEQMQEKTEKKSILYSRMDLLIETCAAALEGHQLKPSIWEDLSFPH